MKSKARTKKQQEYASRPTTAEIVREHRAAAREAIKEALKSPQSARAFLIRAGILDKSGSRLAKPYR